MNVTNQNLFAPRVPRVARKSSKGWVYIIGATEVPKVKIGYSGKPAQRLRELATACPLELKILAKRRGTTQDEKTLHYKLRAYRAHGEWFRLEGDVLDLLNQMALSAPPARKQMWPDGTSRRLTELIIGFGRRARDANRIKRYLQPRPAGEPLERVVDMWRDQATKLGVHESWLTTGEAP